MAKYEMLYLLNNDLTDEAKKDEAEAQKAKELGIPIITETEFLSMVE